MRGGICRNAQTRCRRSRLGSQVDQLLLRMSCTGIFHGVMDGADDQDPSRTPKSVPILPTPGSYPSPSTSRISSLSTPPERSTRTRLCPSSTARRCNAGWYTVPKSLPSLKHTASHIRPPSNQPFLRPRIGPYRACPTASRARGAHLYLVKWHTASARAWTGSKSTMRTPALRRRGGRGRTARR